MSYVLLGVLLIFGHVFTRWGKVAAQVDLAHYFLHSIPVSVYILKHEPPRKSQYEL